MHSLVKIAAFVGVAVALAGCRTAGPQVRLINCCNCTVTISGEIKAEQGKSLPVTIETKAAKNKVPFVP